MAARWQCSRRLPYWCKSTCEGQNLTCPSLLLNASFNKKKLIKVYILSNTCMFAYIVSYCAVDILYDLLVLFSFGFLCLNDSQRKKQRRCLMLSLSPSAWKSPSPPPNYHQMPSINLERMSSLKWCMCIIWEKTTQKHGAGNFTAAWNSFHVWCKKKKNHRNWKQMSN